MKSQQDRALSISGLHRSSSSYEILKIGFTLFTYLMMAYLLDQFSAPLQANDDILHGPEFTFTNPRLIRYGNKLGAAINASEVNTQVRDMWADNLFAACNKLPKNHPDRCVIEKSKRRGSPFFKVIYPDGWWYAITIDPLVVEIIAKPLTLKDAVRMRDRLQRDIWDHARLRVRTFSTEKADENVGLTPHEEIGGGHIHFDVKTAFGNDALLFRNFIVDFSNHPTLALGTLGNSVLNGPPISSLSAEQQQAFSDIIFQFDHAYPRMTIKELSTLITQKVYYKTMGKPGWFGASRHKWVPAEKYQAINITRIVNPDVPDEERTMEIRSLRPEKSADDFIRLITLFDTRIQKLKELSKLNKAVPYLRSQARTSVMEKDPQRMVDEFYSYVTSSGLNWSDYEILLPKEIADLIKKEKVVCGRKSLPGSPLIHKNKDFAAIYEKLIKMIP